MHAVDTNVIVRYLTFDDPDQSGRATAVMEGLEVWISTTVLLETEWVLRRAYRFSVTALVGALRRLAGLSNVALEDPSLAHQALDWCEAGMDFADALHLASSAGREAFLTFDRQLILAAKTSGVAGVREP
jgi:predicted nucleic-acid-binding protein